MMKPRNAFQLGRTSCLLPPCAGSLLRVIATGLALFGATAVLADDAVQLKVLVVSTADETKDQGLAYIRTILDEMGVPYDLHDTSKKDMTAETLSPNGCKAAAAGCVGNYNGIILTDTMQTILTPEEWQALHAYEVDFKVREAVISGFPGTGDAGGYNYGMADIGNNVDGDTARSIGRWQGRAGGPEVFGYVNTSNPLPITDFAFSGNPFLTFPAPPNGTTPSVEPLLVAADTSGNPDPGKTLVSILHYEDGRQVLLSSITNASYLVHSQVLGYEFINFATQGVFVGGRHVYMSAHLDDLFLADELWDVKDTADPSDGFTNPSLTYRLTGRDILNGVAAQSAFRAAHPTVGNGFQLDFPFNGAGAVVDPEAEEKKLKANLKEDLVAAVVANMNAFGFINHTFSHADMDKAPNPLAAPCDYPTLTTVEDITQEITKNRAVWNLLKLPEQEENMRILVSGNHSGLKDRNCTDYPELHPEMLNVQDDDVPFPGGVNPLFLQAAANTGVDYLASDASQLNQNVEQYISQVNDGSNQDRILMPRWPTNIFYNVINPVQLADEYNYIFHWRWIAQGDDPCTIPGAICATRNYDAILAAEADTALRHMLSFKKWPHYFHQTNLADYGGGSTLMFDWLNAVFAEYEKLMVLPVSNPPYYLLGEKTEASLVARSATIRATWDRPTNRVTFSANKSVPKLLVTGLQGGEFYGGQFIREINVNTTPMTVLVASDSMTFSSSLFAIRTQVQSLIDDSATPIAMVQDLEKKVLKNVNTAFEAFLKGEPQNVGKGLKEAIKKLQEIGDAYGYDPSSLQTDLAALAVSELERLIDRVRAVTGPSDDHLLEAEGKLIEARSALEAGHYELAAEDAGKGSDKIKNPKYVGSFCSDTRAEVYYSRLCEIEAIHDDVAELFVTHPKDGKLKEARDKLRDGLAKLAVVDVKEAAKKCREAGQKLADVTAVDVSRNLAELTGLDSKSAVAGLLSQYLTDAEMSAHDPVDLIDAGDLYDLGEFARENADYLDALEHYEQAAALAKP
ncbi:Agd3-related carbohydrate deacetylase [Thiocystis violacea]|uniref:Agd3-related carbohydrate deacetylase n=1 Tax=Thiocystis violacea TaxID=13725 RepID=UPI001905F825|nr:hypothetical protein [Thiocystis violacea]